MLGDDMARRWKVCSEQGKSLKITIEGALGRNQRRHPGGYYFRYGQSSGSYFREVKVGRAGQITEADLMEVSSERSNAVHHLRRIHVRLWPGLLPSYLRTYVHKSLPSVHSVSAGNSGHQQVRYRTS